MSEMSIAYVGPKKVKRDTITGSRQVFPQFEPIKVEKEIAVRLLQYDVFVQEKELDAFILGIEKANKAKIDKAEKAKAEKLKREQEELRTIDVDGDVIDLNKLNKAKLQTLAESQDLDLELGPRESQKDFATRVFLKLQEKQGE